MKNRILVTGATSFLGSYIIAQLIDQGDEVVGYEIRDIPEKSDVGWLLKDYRQNEAFKYVKTGDINDIGQLYNTIYKENITQIVHTAALTDLNHLKNSPMYANQINLIPTINLLEACRIFDISSIVFCSSIAVYAAKQYEPMDEKHPVHQPDKGPALFSYSTTKLASEAFGMQYWYDLGVNFIALRFSGIYGFGMKYPLYIKPILEPSVRGEEVDLTTGGDVQRDLIYVKDAAKAVVLTLKNVTVKTPWRIFNIGHGGEMISVKSFIPIIKEIAHSSQINVGPGLTDTEKQIQTARGILDISKAEKYIGYKPEYDIANGLKEYADNYTAYLDYLEKMGE